MCVRARAETNYGEVRCACPPLCVCVCVCVCARAQYSTAARFSDARVGRELRAQGGGVSSSASQCAGTRVRERSCA